MKKNKLIVVMLFLFAFVLNAQVEINHGEEISKKTPQKENIQASIVRYDITSGADKYYGGAAAAVEVEPGVWAMIAGDADGNGAINATDYLAVLPAINTLGYLRSDVDINGAVNATDYLVIRPNMNKLTYVD
ncbi:MAG: hypothetical protein CR986_03925 [Ignavibacteriae bacterium]|nr:MAG: hypothetical protein CR986_03925 [Ignavibacteriota bacterium]